MLSILVPIYNFKVEKLVKSLMKQCNALKINYEILCFDDGSRKKIKYENSILSDYFGVNYTELSENLGRAKIRNWMAKSASYENLIFLDCDSKIVSSKYIANYISHINNYDVINGGRIYSKKQPRAKSKYLHWKYGRKRESVSARKRNKEVTMYFHSNNFLVRREIMLDFPFDEKIQGYGYEDLEWATKLNNSGINILNIDNPVEHLGLETASVFIQKTRKSIDNLILINKSKMPIQTKLTRIARMMENWGVKKYFMSYFKSRIVDIEIDLIANRLGLWSLMVYKLYYYFSSLDQLQNEQVNLH